MRQRRGQLFGLRTGCAHPVSVQQRRAVHRRFEILQDEAPRAAQRQMTVALAQRVVEEPRQDVLLLAQAAQLFEKTLLRRAVYDEVRA